jgi:hypothetical protein
MQVFFLVHLYMCNDRCLIFIWQRLFLQLATLGPDWVLQYTRNSRCNPRTTTVACWLCAPSSDPPRCILNCKMFLLGCLSCRCFSFSVNVKKYVCASFDFLRCDICTMRTYIMSVLFFLKASRPGLGSVLKGVATQ